MIVRCTNCRTAFSVHDSKVRNKRFSFSCPKCAEENVFDNREDNDLHGLDSVSTGVSADFSDDSFTASNGADRSDAKRARVEDEDFPDISSAGDSLDLADDSDSIDEISSIKSTGRTAEQKDADLALDGIDTNINLDDIDIDVAAEDKSVRHDDSVFEESDLILDDFEEDGKKSGGDLVLDELSDELDVKKTGDSEIDDLNIDDMLVPDAEEPPVKGKADRGDILDLEQDLIALDDVESEKKSKDSVSIDDELDLDFSDEIPPVEEKTSAKKITDNEDITLDVDSLDLELNGDEELLREVRKGIETSSKDTQAAKGVSSSKEEDLTLDLASLDIELSEDEIIMEGEKPDDIDFLEPAVADKPKRTAHDTDDDLTLDLDSLDITLEETDEVMKGEIPDEDEKLTLQDAGLTLEELTTDESSAVLEGHDADEEDDIKLTLEEIDPSLSGDLNELTTDEITATIEAEEEEDIKLSIDEIDPSLSVDDIGGDIIIEDLPEAGTRRGKNDSLLIEEIDEFPEIELDDVPVLTPGKTGSSGLPSSKRERGRNKRVYEEELIDIDLGDDINVPVNKKKQKDLADAAVKGSVSLSIDHSIKYSRLGALARLVGIFAIIMIPHFIVFLLYTVLSCLLGFLNQIIILARRDGVEDFSQIVENTVRYFIAIYSSMIGIVEVFPVFTGRDNVDYPLQLKVTYPLHNSRLMALFRLSIIGMFIALFPHLLIAAILSFGIPLMFLVGIVAVVITGKWPSMLFDFFTRYYRYCSKILCFGTGIVDVYPPFRFD